MTAVHYVQYFDLNRSQRVNNVVSVYLRSSRLFVLINSKIFEER